MKVDRFGFELIRSRNQLPSTGVRVAAQGRQQQENRLHRGLLVWCLSAILVVLHRIRGRRPSL